MTSQHTYLATTKRLHESRNRGETWNGLLLCLWSQRCHFLLSPCQTLEQKTAKSRPV